MIPLRCSGVVLALAAPGCVIQVHQAEDLTEITDPFTAIALDVDSGAVDLRVTEDGVVTVAREAEWTSEPPQMQLYVEDSVLIVRSACPAGEWVCATSHTLVVPAEVALGGAIGSGGVFAEGLAGEVDLDVGSGGMVLVEHTGPVWAVVGSGGFVGEDLVGDLDITVGSGAVDASWVEPPTALLAHVSSGGVEVALPAGSYNLSVEVASGGVEVDDAIVHDPSSPYRVELRADSGGVEVDAR